MVGIKLKLKNWKWSCVRNKACHVMLLDLLPLNVHQLQFGLKSVLLWFFHVGVSVLFGFPLFSTIFLLLFVSNKLLKHTPFDTRPLIPPCESPYHFSLNVSPLFHSLTKHAEFNCSTVKASGASRVLQVSKALKHTKDRQNNRGTLRGENIGVRGNWQRRQIRSALLQHQTQIAGAEVALVDENGVRLRQKEGRSRG